MPSDLIYCPLCGRMQSPYSDCECEVFPKEAADAE
jgi:hypothetical protein